MASTISVAKIDRFFEFQQALEGSPVTFEYALRPAPGVDVAEAVEGCPGLLGIREEGGLVWLHFDHGFADGLGTFASLRGHLSGRPAPRAIELPVGPDSSKPPPRRALTRLRSPAAKLCEGTAPEPAIVCWDIDERPDAPKASLLQRAVAATHLAALAAIPEGACSSILNSTSCAGWTPGRPASNASGGFFSVVTDAERASVADHVRAEFRAARGSQQALMRRIEVFGSLPRFAWPPIIRLARRSDQSAGGTASLAALVGIDDEHLARLGTDWYIVAPFRRSSTLTLTIAGVNGKLTATAGAWDPPERIAGIAEGILDSAGFDTRRIH